MKSLASPNRVFWYEIIAFTVLFITIWVGSLLPLFLYKRNAMEWEDPLLESAVLILVAIPTLICSKRILNHLHHLEGFLRICAWCHKVKVGNDWIPMEEFLNRRLSTKTSHGICEICNTNFRDELEERLRTK